MNSLSPLVVRGKNIRRGGNRRVSFLDEMYIDVYGFNIRFLQRKIVLVSLILISLFSCLLLPVLKLHTVNILQVNGERVAPPYSPVDGLSITMNSRQLQLTTDFGLTVRFDGSIRGGNSWTNLSSSLTESLFGRFLNLFISLLCFCQRSYCPAPIRTLSGDCVETTMASPETST